jgi:hypothetical protein
MGTSILGDGHKLLWPDEEREVLGFWWIAGACRLLCEGERGRKRA